MSDWRQRVRDGLTRNIAVTSPTAADPDLRGRTYGIPYDQVWRAALRLASGRLRGWTLVDADDYDGVIRAEIRSRLFRTVDDFVVRITLDSDGQTRVDARSSSRGSRGDFGANARRLRRFFAALDEELAASRPGTSRSAGHAARRPPPADRRHASH
ncbi:MAG TPA: DUF1499 domain-containing protein [Longimicrobiales bacterium]